MRAVAPKCRGFIACLRLAAAKSCEDSAHERSALSPGDRRRSSAVPRRVARGGDGADRARRDRRGRHLRGGAEAARQGRRGRSRAARSLDARRARLLRPDVSARAISERAGGGGVGQRRSGGDPPLHGFRRLGLHPEDARHRADARGDQARARRRGVDAARRRSLRRRRRRDRGADGAARDADAAAGARADDAVGGHAQQADRLRAHGVGGDGEGACLGDPAEARRRQPDAGGDRRRQDRARPVAAGGEPESMLRLRRILLGMARRLDHALRALPSARIARVHSGGEAPCKSATPPRRPAARAIAPSARAAPRA